MNRYQGQNKRCSFCGRKWARAQCTAGEFQGKPAWFCKWCVKAMGEATDAATVRRLSEERGRAR